MAKKEGLSQAKMAVAEALHHDSVGLVDDKVVRDYAEDLGNLLAASLIAEGRGFLRSFVDKIEAYGTEVKMRYTIPVPPDSTSEETVGAIPIVRHGKGRSALAFGTKAFCRRPC